MNKDLQESCFDVQECVRTFIYGLLICISLCKLNFLFGVNFIDKNNFFILFGLSVCALYLGLFVFKKALSIGFVLYGLLLSLVVTLGFNGLGYSVLTKILFLSFLLALVCYFFCENMINKIEKKLYNTFYLGSLQQWLAGLSLLVIVSLLTSFFISLFFLSPDSVRYNKEKEDFFIEVSADDYSDAYSKRQDEWEKTDAFLKWRKCQEKEEQKCLIIYECFSLIFLYIGSVLTLPIFGASFLGLSLICVFKSFIWGGFCNNSFFLFKLFFIFVTVVSIFFFTNIRRTTC